MFVAEGAWRKSLAERVRMRTIKQNKKNESKNDAYMENQPVFALNLKTVLNLT